MKTGSASPGPAQPFFGSRGFLQRKCASCVAEPFFGSAAGRIQRQAADEVALEPAELEPAGPEPEAEAEAEAEQAFEAEPAPEQEPGPEPEAAEPVAEKPEAVEEEPEAALQPRLEVGAVDDPLELEADAMADRVVRRQAAAPAGELREEAVQPKADDGGGAASPAVDAGIASTCRRSGSTPAPPRPG